MGRGKQAQIDCELDLVKTDEGEDYLRLFAENLKTSGASLAVWL
jgi:hypothetical protein